MYVCMYVCMDGWMDGWMDAWMYGWMHVCVCMNESSCLFCGLFVDMCIINIQYVAERTICNAPAAREEAEEFPEWPSLVK